MFILSSDRIDNYIIFSIFSLLGVVGVILLVFIKPHSKVREYISKPRPLGDALLFKHPVILSLPSPSLSLSL